MELQTIGSTPIEEWLVEARFIVENVIENKRATFIKRHLVGDARLEIASTPKETQENTEKIFEVIEEVFGVRETERDLMKKMLTLRKKSDESILTFSHRIMSVGGKLTIFKKTEEINLLQRESLIEGVNPKLQWDLKFRVQSKPGVTFRELRNVASEWEKTVGEDMMETGHYKVDVRDNIEEFRQENICLKEELTKIKRERDQLLFEKQQYQRYEPTLRQQNYQVQPNWNSPLRPQYPNQQYPERPNQRDRNIQDLTCYRCQEKGHLSKACRAVLPYLNEQGSLK